MRCVLLSDDLFVFVVAISLGQGGILDGGNRLTLLSAITQTGILSWSAVAIWSFLAVAMSVASFASLMASYYPDRFGGWTDPSFLWTQRYRIIRGVDHAGMWLEVVFSLLLALNMFGLAVFVYPETAQAMLSLGWYTWVTIALLAAAGIYTAYFCFSASHQAELANEVRQCQPKIVAKLRQRVADELEVPVADLTDEEFLGTWQLESKRLTRIYYCYVVHSVLTWWMLAIGILLFAGGAWSDYWRLSVAVDGLYAAQVVSPDEPLTGGAGGIDDAALGDGQRLARRFTNFREQLLGVVNRFLGTIALFSLLFFWLLGTRFQDIFALTTQNIYRSIACVFLLFLLPGIVVFGYVRFVTVAEWVHSQFHDLDAIAAEGSSPGHLEQFGELRERVIESASVPGFMARIASSWGSVLILLQFVVSRIEAHRLDWKFTKKLIPDARLVRNVRSRLGLFFTDPDEDDLFDVLSNPPPAQPEDEA